MLKHAVTLRNQKGIISVVTLLVLIAVGVLTLNMVINSRMNATSADNYKNKIQSFYAADGIMTLLAQEMIDTAEDHYLQDAIHDIDFETQLAGSWGYNKYSNIDTVRGAGKNLYGARDQIHFTYTPVKGDIDMSVRVVSLSYTSVSAVGGLMIRSELSSQSKCVTVYWPYVSHQIWMKTRDADAAYIDSSATTNPGTGDWLRLKRDGDIFKAYRSSNGYSWTLVGSDSIVMPDTVYAGLMVCSYLETQLCTGLFADLRGLIRRSYTDSIVLASSGNTSVKYTINEVAPGVFSMTTEAFKKNATGAQLHVAKLDQSIAREAEVSWNVTAPDSVKIPVTFYDFKSDLTNPEFNVKGHIQDNNGVFYLARFVQNTLDSDRKPQPKQDLSGFREAFLNLFGSNWYSMSSCDRIFNINRVMNSERADTLSKYGAFSWDFSDNLSKWFRPSDAPGAVFDTVTGRWSNLVNRRRSNGTIISDEWVGSNYDSTASFANIVIYDSLTFRKKSATDTGVFVFGDSIKIAVNQLDTQFFICNCTYYCPYTKPTWPFTPCKKNLMTCASDTAMAYAFEPLKFMPLKNRGFGYQEDRYIPIEKNIACVNSHNFAFTMELHKKFTYKRGQYFAFSGDDDVWVFINNKLELDLGGIHGNIRDTIKMDNLGLTEGKEYNFDMFYCERCVGASNILITTNMLAWTPPQTRKRSWRRDYGNLD